MKDQYTLIQGYRDLTQDEIDKINRIKIAECLVLELIKEISDDLHNHFEATHDVDEIQRLDDAEPSRWLSIARTDIQTGFMALVRSVAQPRPNKLGPKS